MPRSKLAYRALSTVAVAWFLLPLSCVPVGILYPSVSYVRPVPVTVPADEVRAFRVDVTDRRNCIDFQDADCYLLKPVPVSKSGAVPAQVGVGVDYAWVWHCIALSYFGSTHHSVLVRLYRPGWQTVQVHSWAKALKPVWKKAATKAEQEKAVDDLLSTWQTDFDNPRAEEVGPQGQASAAPRDRQVFRHLAPGSASARHREVLLFAGGEYERLAAAGGDEVVCSRLAEKAKVLRELSGE